MTVGNLLLLSGKFFRGKTAAVFSAVAGARKSLIVVVDPVGELVKIFSAEIIVIPYIQPDLGRAVPDRHQVVSGKNIRKFFF